MFRNKSKKKKVNTIVNPFASKNGAIKKEKELMRYCRLISCFTVFAKRYLDCIAPEDPSFAKRYESFMLVANDMSNMFEVESGSDAIFARNLEYVEKGIEEIEDYLDSRRENDKYKFLLLVSGTRHIFETINPYLHFLNTVEIMKKAELKQKRLPNNPIAKKIKKQIQESAVQDVAESRKTYSEFLRLFQGSDTLNRDKSIQAFITNRLL
jgi:hypothetical protein